MDKTISQNVELMPPPFSDGLEVWSRQNGIPGTANYANSNSAQILLTDPDFEECLEIVTNRSPQKLRFMGQTPFTPGCYLRVSARVKVVSGVLPDFEIAGFPIGSDGNLVTGIFLKGDSVTATQYDKVIEVSAIYGSGDRPGVDCVWGLDPVHAHFGLNVVGAANGASVRVESIRIEDVTSAFLRVSMDWVDVLDYGARGDGVFDNAAAFAAADAAANGREVLVPEGDFFISGSITLDSQFRFVGRVLQAEDKACNLLYGLNYANYLDAFKDETLALKKALRTLLNDNDHDSLDLNGRQINLTEPLDVQNAVANRSSFNSRRAIRNGKIVADPAGSWPLMTTTATASYAGGLTLTNVQNISSVKRGMLVSGAGVGREVYVKDVDEVTSTVTLSQLLYAAAASQSYTFTKFAYLLDFVGFDDISNLEIDAVEFNGSSVASGILLPTSGFNWHVHDSWFFAVRDRGLTSPGDGDFSIAIDQCDFSSAEGGIPASSRTSIGFNCNANDAKVRGNRGARFKHFAVIGGANAIFTENHFFQGQTGDDSRTAGVVFARSDASSIVRDNYIDNCWVEWSNEYTPANPTFRQLMVDGNLCFSAGVAADFNYVRMMPHLANMQINGMSISSNIFNVSGTTITKATAVDTSRGTLSPSSINFEAAGNTFKNIANTAVTFP
ncbi:MAG: glycosyl hydrolase family 28-related protein [Pikeienuella sp.]